MVDLRDYQKAFVADLWTAMRSHRRVLGVAPTGSGKTVVFSFISQAAMKNDRRVIITAHRVEIVNQISASLDRMGVRHGRIQSGHMHTRDLVQVGMVQTVAKRIGGIDEPDLCIVDEAQHGVAGTWKRIADQWQRAKFCGFTASPIRMDNKGLGDAFETMVHGPSTAWLMQNNFLASYDYYAPPVVADLSALKSSGADYSMQDNAAAMMRAVVTGDSVEHYRRLLTGRSAIAFCVSIAHAEHVAKQFRDAGYRAESVDGTTDPSMRARLIANVGNGKLDVLASCDLISEGTDIPAVGGAILLRRTKSLAMFLQQCGRVLRLKADGSRAVILDHVGNVGLHGLPDAERQWSLATTPKREARTVETAQCKGCWRTFDATSPTWKVGKPACTDAPDCLFGARETAARAEMEQVAGELAMVERQAAERIQEIRSKPLSTLMTTAKTRADFVEIAKAKGYQQRWVDHALGRQALYQRSRKTAA